MQKVIAAAEWDLVEAAGTKTVGGDEDAAGDWKVNDSRLSQWPSDYDRLGLRRSLR